jgi:hypothetical protein
MPLLSVWVSCNIDRCLCDRTLILTSDICSTVEYDPTDYVNMLTSCRPGQAFNKTSRHLPRDCGSQVVAILTVKVSCSLRPGFDLCSLTSERDYLKAKVRSFKREQGRRGPVIGGEKGNFPNRTCKESSSTRQPHLMMLHQSEAWYVQRSPRSMIEAGSDCP